MTQKTITEESIANKISRMLKKEIKSRKFIYVMMILAIALGAGYFVGYTLGYHDALVDFNIIQATIYRV